MPSSPAPALARTLLLACVSAGSMAHAVEPELVPAIAPELYELVLTLEEGGFRGRLTISARAAAETRLVNLHATGLRVTEVDAVAPRESLSVATWSSRDDVLRIRLSRSLAPNEPIRLYMEYAGGYADSGGEGLVKSIDGARVVNSTQLQPAAARRVFPSIDHPCCPSRFRLTVISPHGQPAFSNTPVASRTVHGDRVVTRFEASGRMAPHLLALVAGDVEATPAGSHRSIAGPPRPLRVIAPAGTTVPASALGTMVERLLSGFERWLGLELPTRKLDLALVPGFRYFGMENPGLLVLRAELVEWAARENRWTDLEELVAHELAHQWFGNRLAPARWRDIWISESFATWAAAQIAAPATAASPPVYRLTHLAEAERGLSPPVAPSYPLVERHPAAIFTSSRYDTGARLLDDLFADVDDVGRRVAEMIVAAGDTPLTSQDLLELFGRTGIEPVRLEAFAETLRRKRPPLLEIERSCGHDEPAVLARWVRGRSPRPRVCVDVYAGLTRVAAVCGPNEGTEVVLPVSTCPELVLPRPGALGYATWVFDDPGDYRVAADRLSGLGEDARLDLLVSILAAVWTERLDASTAAGMVGREAATSTSEDGDSLRDFVIGSLSDLGAAVSSDQDPRSELPAKAPPAWSPDELRRLATRRDRLAVGEWNTMLEALPAQPPPTLLWLFESAEDWPWEGREAASFLQSLAASGSSIWDALEPEQLDRFLRAAVPERYWDDVARALGRTCGRSTLDLVAGTEAFLEPHVLEQRDTALLAIASCLHLRESHERRRPLAADSSIREGASMW